MAGKPTKKKEVVRLTREVKDFILEKMHQGMDISEICRRFKDKVPARETIYRAGMKDKEFEEELNSAYSVLMMIRLDNLHELSSKTASEAYPGIDWREAEATLKRQIDTHKFVLGKMAPILSNRFNKTDKLEVSGISAGPQIAVMNYYLDDAPQQQMKVIPQVINSPLISKEDYNNIQQLIDEE